MDANFIALCLDARAPYDFDCAEMVVLQQPPGNVVDEEQTHLLEGVQLTTPMEASLSLVPREASSTCSET